MLAWMASGKKKSASGCERAGVVDVVAELVTVAPAEKWALDLTLWLPAATGWLAAVMRMASWKRRALKKRGKRFEQTSLC